MESDVIEKLKSEILNSLNDLVDTEFELIYTVFLSSDERDRAVENGHITRASLLRFAEKKGKLIELAKRLNISIANEGGIQIRFVNREAEKQEITDALKDVYNRSVFVFAPSGYGKSALLLEMKSNLEGKGWKCFNFICDTDNHKLPTDLINLSNSLTKHQINRDSAEDNGALGIGELFASSVYYDINDNQQSHNIAIFIDRVDEFPPQIINHLKEFIIGFFGGMKNIQNHDDSNLVVFLAGFPTITFLECETAFYEEVKLSCYSISLSPFDYKAVQETTNRYITRMNNRRSPKPCDALAAARLTFLSGGHPGIIAKYLKKLAENNFSTITTFGSNPPKSELLQDVSNVIGSVIKTLQNQDEQLYDAYKALCFFRRYDVEWFVQLLIDDGTIRWADGDGQSLIGKLQQNKLLIRKDKLFCDHILRKLFVIKILNEEPKQELAELIEKGIKLYEMEFRDQTIDRDCRLEAAIEWIYLHVFRGIYNITVINDIGEEFITRTNNVLDAFRPIFRKRYKTRERDFLSMLENDEDLKFLINYHYIQDDVFKPGHYKELLQRIREGK